MQIVGGPVGRDVGTVAPDGAHFHTAHCLPDVLPILNVIAVEQELSVCSYNLARNRRRLPKNFSAYPAKHAKGTYKDGNEDYPKFLHDKSSSKIRICF